MIEQRRLSIYAGRGRILCKMIDQTHKIDWAAFPLIKNLSSPDIFIPVVYHVDGSPQRR